MDRFLSLVHNAEDNHIPAHIGNSNFEVELGRSIDELKKAKSGPLVRFAPLILNKLLQLLVRQPSGQVGKFCI